MNFIDIDAIQVLPNRTRRAFDEGAGRELVESIERTGLMHAIVLRVEGDSYALVAGERRLRAIRDIYDLGGSFTYAGEPVVPSMVPYISIGELSPLEALEAEIEENARRADLSWQEKAAATADLMRLRTEQARLAEKPLPTVSDIAKEVRDSDVGWSHTETKRELVLAKYLDDPDVQKAKTSDEAFKILQRKESAKKSTALSASVGRTFSAQMHTLRLENSLVWLEGCEGDSFDCILTDPPYGMGADEFGDSGGATPGAHGYEDTAANFYRMMKTLPAQLFRVAKPQAHLYLFCDIDYFPFLKSEFADAGWKVFRTPLIWFKPSAYRAPWPDQGPQRKYETILYAVKGDRKTLKLGGDVLQYPPDNNLGHAAQKPIALFSDLLARSCMPGDTALDPFCGSGPIFPAAHEIKVRAVGIEMDPKAHGIAAKRLQELK